MQAFFVLLQLLEDEDPTVRAATARSAGQAVAVYGGEDCSSAAVAYVQLKTFDVAAINFGTRKGFAQKLLAWIYE